MRHLLCTQALICFAALIAGALLFPLTAWPLSFGAGAILAAYSLWGIARFSQASTQRHYSAMLGFKAVCSFTGRFLVIGAVLFVLIVLLGTPVIPLVIGLSSSVAGITAWGISRYFGKTATEA